MTDRITANLPSRNFDLTEAFYARLGFSRIWRSEGWMILQNGGMEIEFFPHPDLIPGDSWFSACVRVRDPEALRLAWAPGLPTDGIPRITAMFQPGADAPRMFALVDPDGSLLRVMAG